MTTVITSKKFVSLKETYLQSSKWKGKIRPPLIVEALKNYSKEDTLQVKFLEISANKKHNNAQKITRKKYFVLRYQT